MRTMEESLQLYRPQLLLSHLLETTNLSLLSQPRTSHSATPAMEALDTITLNTQQLFACLVESFVTGVLGTIELQMILPGMLDTPATVVLQEPSILELLKESVWLSALIAYLTSSNL